MSTQPPQKPTAAGAKPAPLKAQGQQGPQPVPASKTNPQAQASTDADGKKRPVGVREELDEIKEQGAFYLWIRERFSESPGYLASAVVHAIVLIILALIYIAPEVKSKIVDLVASVEEEDMEEIEEINPDIQVQDLIVDPTQEMMQEVITDNIQDEPEISDFMEEPAAQLNVELTEFSDLKAEKSLFMNTVGSTTGKNPMGGRGKAARSAMVAQGGGNQASEQAVAWGLKWLAAHQNPDGSWSFNHGVAPTHEGPVNNPGNAESRTGATAMALLPFLGAGQTHKEGEYQDVVYRGLHFLTRSMKFDANKGGDLRGEKGRLYEHGLASIVLCEAYALTQDKSLMQPAQQALNYITYAQDKTGDGWRYSPGQPGDTSVVGWQLMALKSGHLAYLKVPKQTIAGAIHFLDSVMLDYTYYGYTGPQKRASTTAIGVLCRMYLGTKKEDQSLQDGVAYLSQLGPSKSDMYYNYYATQVMHHYGGDEWKKWNGIMRDQLVNSQVKTGSFRAEKGSWTPVQKTGHKIEKGGRLYFTSLCIMTLEVYYRYLPLYKEQPVNDDF